MFLFLIKKTFFDFWENLSLIALLNSGYLILFGAFYLTHIPNLPIADLCLKAIYILLLFVYTGGVSGMMKSVADGGKESIASFSENLQKHHRSSLLFGLLFLSIFGLFSGSVYLREESLLTFRTLFIGKTFWFLLGVSLYLQWFFPVITRFEGNTATFLKKSALLFADNLFLSFLLLFHSLIIMILSIFAAFIIPGIAVVLLLLNNCLKFQLLKYHYLEENTTAGRKIPWDTLLQEERGRLGKKTLKNFFFPWKD